MSHSRTGQPTAIRQAPTTGSSSPGALSRASIDDLIRRAFAEDEGDGDITTLNTVPESARASGVLRAKASGTLAGLHVFRRVFEMREARVDVELLASDGERCEPGQVLARLEGSARSLLVAERTALNLLQHMSGIATRTRALVDLAAGRADVLDTRKTLPGLRALQKYAVRCGGGVNHRFGLYDEAMIKDNHLAHAGLDLESLCRRLRGKLGPSRRIIAEARDEAEAEAAVRGDADVVLLDNMSPEVMADLVPRLRILAQACDPPRTRELELEASGNISEATVAAVAGSGVDRISSGALTHSVEALDLSLSLEPQLG